MHRRKEMFVSSDEAATSLKDSTWVVESPNEPTNELPPSLNSPGKSTLINGSLWKRIELGTFPTTDAIATFMDFHIYGDFKRRGLVEVGEIVGLDGEKAADVDGLGVSHGGGASVSGLGSTALPELNATSSPPPHLWNQMPSLIHTSLTLRILTTPPNPLCNLCRSSLLWIRMSITPKFHKSYRGEGVIVINEMDISKRNVGEDDGDQSKKRVVNYVVQCASELLNGWQSFLWVREMLYRWNCGARLIQVHCRHYSGRNPTYLTYHLTAASKIKAKFLIFVGVPEGILLNIQKSWRNDEANWRWTSWLSDYWVVRRRRRRWGYEC